MAENVMINVDSNFDVSLFSKKLAETYQMKGYSVRTVSLGSSTAIEFSKNDDGISKFVGLVEKLRATVMVSNGVLSINFSEAEWTSKIIGFVIGWFLCWIPWITVVMGFFRQSSLSKNIEIDAAAIAAGMQQSSDSQMPPM